MTADTNAPGRPLTPAEPADDRADSEANSAAILISRIAGELQSLATDLTVFQATLSDVIAAGTLGAQQMHDLQDLDRATQTLENLHRVAAVLAETHPTGVDAPSLSGLVTLKDLELRLAGRPRPEAPPSSGDIDEISWL